MLKNIVCRNELWTCEGSDDLVKMGKGLFSFFLHDEYECKFRKMLTLEQFSDKENRIMKEVEEADILIFTTPTYCLRASAPMKSFIDLTFNYWMSHRPRKCMFNKKAVVISTAAGSGAKKAVKDVSDALFYWGIPCIVEYGICIQAMNWDGVSEKKKQKIEKDTIRIAQRLSRKKCVKAGIKTKAIFSLMRMMQKADLGSGEADKTYWEKSGWLGKERPWRMK